VSSSSSNRFQNEYETLAVLVVFPFNESRILVDFLRVGLRLVNVDGRVRFDPGVAVVGVLRGGPPTATQRPRDSPQHKKGIRRISDPRNERPDRLLDPTHGEPDRVVAERDHDDPGDDDREADF